MATKFFGLLMIFTAACVGSVVEDPPAGAVDGAAGAEPVATRRPTRAWVAPSCCGVFSCAEQVVAACSACQTEWSCCTLVTGAPCLQGGTGGGA